MPRKKKEATEVIKYIDEKILTIDLWEDMRLEQFLEAIDPMFDDQKFVGCHDLRVQPVYERWEEHDFRGFTIWGKRPETESEKTARLERERKVQEKLAAERTKLEERNKANEYKAYLRLRKKYEGL